MQSTKITVNRKLEYVKRICHISGMWYCKDESKIVSGIFKRNAELNVGV